MTYQVYVKVEYPDRIVAVEQRENLTSVRHWVLIDEGEGDRYQYAKDQYFDKPLAGAYGVPNYRLVGRRPVERAAAEIAEDIRMIELPGIEPTADVDALLAAEIMKARTLDELKAALTGENGIAKVKASKK